MNNYDYSKHGFYFITINVMQHDRLFGKIINQQVELNPAGKMVESWYYKLEEKFPDIKCCEMVVMPNHYHCIIEKSGLQDNGSSIPQVIQWFKTMTTTGYIRGVRNEGWPKFLMKLWQRGYWDHIISSGSEYDKYVVYINNNPKQE